MPPTSALWPTDLLSADNLGTDPRAMLPTHATPATVLGIDVGGTKTSVGAVRFPEARVLVQRTVPTEAGHGAAAVLEHIARLAEWVAEESTRLGNPIASVGLGLCELVDSSGRIQSHNCLAWDSDLVIRRLSPLGPVTLEADVRAAARAEAWFGAGRPYRLFLYITVGTGIACSLVIDGMPYLGARGASGTMASSPLVIPCSQCGHLNRQTLEEIAAGPALAARLNQRRPGAARNGQEVLAAAAAGDAEALEVVRSGGQALESAAALLVNVLDPEAVIVGGGLGLSEGPFWEHFVAATRTHIWSELHRGLPILRAQTGVHAGLVGAAASAWAAAEAR